MTDKTQEFLKLVTVEGTVFGLVRDPDGATRIGISGHLLHGNRTEFKGLVLEQLDAGAKDVVIDCLRCGYIDSSGAATLVSVSHRVTDKGGTFRVEGLTADLTQAPAPAKEATDG